MYGFLLLLSLTIPSAIPNSVIQAPVQQAIVSTQQNPPEPGPNRQTKTEQNSRIQRSAEDALRGDQLLTGANVQVTVDDYDLTLTGKVESYQQHQRALALMQQYARYRQIVDKLQAK